VRPRRAHRLLEGGPGRRGHLQLPRPCGLAVDIQAQPAHRRLHPRQRLDRGPASTWRRRRRHQPRGDVTDEARPLGARAECRERLGRGAEEAQAGRTLQRVVAGHGAAHHPGAVASRTQPLEDSRSPTRSGCEQSSARRARTRRSLDPSRSVAGSGQFALPAARQFGQVIAVDVSPAMLQLLSGRAAAAGLKNLRCVEAGFLSYEHTGPPVDGVSAATPSISCLTSGRRWRWFV